MISHPHYRMHTLHTYTDTHTYTHIHTPTHSRYPACEPLCMQCFLDLTLLCIPYYERENCNGSVFSASEPCAQVKIYTLYSSAWLAHTHTWLAPNFPLSLPTSAWRSVQIICGFVRFALFLFILYKITQFATAEQNFSMLNACLGSQKKRVERERKRERDRSMILTNSLEFTLFDFLLN